MQPVTSPVNPFALMIDPKAVFERIERSERLERLQRRVCRPLDKPLIPIGGVEEGAEAEDMAGDTLEDAQGAGDAAV